MIAQCPPPFTLSRSTGVESQDLRKAGLKVTLPRMKILEILESRDTSRHMSAEDVYKALLEAGEDIGLATVYRVLTQFEAAGLVSRHHFEGGHSVFELEQGHHHDHIVCVRCGRVDEFIDEVIEERQQAIARKAGYEMTDHSLYIYGICADCRKEQGGK
ncbi:ferric iron uptake transcriptional regulator [Thiohalobacter sp.]|uniref:ferric iron uptake transcriptional regulator n=1 Tax=Thiohalobacter sp. TaxID=2025948 RepID=UPI00294FFB88|nr:ferric iron uptake transcriptional regulator [Thiohalobacter sp.]